MGMFDAIESAINAAIKTTIAEDVQPVVSLLSDRVVALENGRVQSTFVGDVENALTAEQREAVVRIVSDEVENVDVDNSDAIKEAVSDAIRDYDFSDTVNEAVSDAMYGFDPSEWCYVMPSDFIQSGDYDPDSWVTDEAFSSFREEIENAINAIEKPQSVEGAISQDDLDTAVERLLGRIEEFEEGTIGQDEISEIRSDLSSLENRISDIEDALRALGNTF